MQPMQSLIGTRQPEFPFGELKCRCSMKYVRPILVVVGAAQVVAAMRAHQLAPVANKPMRTRRADLAMMLHRLLIKRAGRTTLWDFRRKISVERNRPLWEHARQISIVRWLAGTSYPGLRPMHQDVKPRWMPPAAAYPSMPDHRIPKSPRRNLWQARQVRFGQVL